MRTENDFCANKWRAVSTQSRIDVHARHTSPRAFHMCRYSCRSFGIDMPHFPYPGRSRSPVCLEPLLPNHIITALKADMWQKPPKVSKVRAQQLLLQLLSHRPLLLRDAGGVFVQGYHLPLWRVPPQLSPWNTKLERLLQKQRPSKGRGTEQP